VVFAYEEHDSERDEMLVNHVVDLMMTMWVSMNSRTAPTHDRVNHRNIAVEICNAEVL
jgi:hypothetical protein